MKILKKIVLVLNVITALALIAGGICIYINPANGWIFSFFGLIFPASLAVNIFFLFFWMVVRFKYMVVSIIALLISIPVLKSYFAFHFFKSEIIKPSDEIRIMSYNVRNFDLYNWTHEKGTLEETMKLIDQEKLSIICFQEFYNAPTGNFQTINLLKQLGFQNYYFDKTYTRKFHNDSWGVAVFSKYPIENSGTVQFDSTTQNACCFVDLKIDSQTVRVFNVHLQSIYLSKEDYQYIEDITENQDVKVEPTKELASKFKRAFLLRAQQAKKIEDAIQQSPLPTMVCGDFNDTPASFAYHTLSNHLQDSFLKAGWGIGATYSGLFNTYRIDYIFADEKFSVLNYNTLCKKYSDHYPVVSAIHLN